MSSREDKKMLKDFGFKDYKHLNQYFNILKSGKNDRSEVYRFKWRLTMMSKYKNYNPPEKSVKEKIIKFHTGYEDYVLQSCKGRASVWPKKTLRQYEFLFKQLQNPWYIDNTYKIKRLYSISDPKKNLWFRAISHYEMIEALDICYRERARFSTKTKPPKTYKLGLNWYECVASFSKARNKQSRFYPGMTPKDYDVALLICDNITSTWNTKTGNWKPWDKNNRWLQLAYWDESYISLKNLRHRNVKFRDVASFVNTSAMKGNAMAYYMLGVAYTVGGSRAAKIINRFSSKKGINFSRKSIQNNKKIPNASRTYKKIDATKRYNKLIDNINPFK